MSREKITLQSAIEEDNILSESADIVGLNVELPNVGTKAYEKLKQSCERYTEAVINFNYTISSPNLITNEKAKENSEKGRRSIHNQLCVMLLGTTWKDTSEEDRRIISDFAVTVGGREDYAGTF